MIHTEQTTAAGLRERAADARRMADVYGRPAHPGMFPLIRPAARMLRRAERLEALARLVECHPFESDRLGPAHLARHQGNPPPA